MFETKSGVFYIAGLGFFVLAFLASGVVPILMYSSMPEKTAEEMVNPYIRDQFRDLVLRYEPALKKHYPDINTELMKKLRDLQVPAGEERTKAEAEETKAIADMLRRGRKTYVGEGCWHCHSQFVRPVSNEEQRWGPVSRSWEYQNELQRPVLFGTRRVGPDLSREGGRKSNDWHAAHFFKPKLTSPQSVMPEYPWFFDGSPDEPNERGLAMIIYMQWLGSWLEKKGYYNNYRLPEGQGIYREVNPW
jgi:hypothetical protein